MSAWMRLARFVAPQRHRIAAALSLSLVACGLGVATPLLGVRVLRAAVGNTEFAALWIPGAMLIAAAAIQSAATAGNSLLLGRLALDLCRDLRRQLYVRLQQLPLAWFDRTPTGNILSRVVDDVGMVQSLAGAQTLTILIETGISAGGAIWLWTRSWRLGAAVALLTPLYLLIFRLYSRRIRAGTHDVRRQLDLVFAHLKQKIDGILVVRASAGDSREVAEFHDRIDRLHQPRVRVSGLGITFSSLCNGVGSIGAALVFAVGACEVAKGRLTTGELIAASALAGLIFGPITRLSELASAYQQAAACLQRLAEIFDAPVADGGAAAVRMETSGAHQRSGRIEFDSVGFGYSPGQPVLHEVSLVVEPGMRVAIVGRTGSGKTTLLNLLLRFYHPGSGTIRLDGRPLGEIPDAELRSRIGIVLQEATVFRGTLAENVGYGSSAGRNQIEAAARAALLDDLADRLPAGYETKVGEGGHPLSHGERQRIAIARLLCKNPSIVVLDEATSNLDGSSEKEVQQALETLLARRTTLIIAHRLATIRQADRIVVLEQGRIVQQGTHDELMADAAGSYRRLFDCQSAGATDVSGPKLPRQKVASLSLQPTAA